jgi:hypothetical protein
LDLQGVKAEAPETFFIPKNSFMVAELKREIKMFKYFLNGYLGGV